LEDNENLSLVPLTGGKHCIRYKWVFKLKYNIDSPIDGNKALLVVKGYTHEAWIDFSDIFSLVAKLTSVRVLLAIVARGKIGH